MKPIIIAVPENVGTIIFKLGTLPHPDIATLTAEEVTVAETARQVEHDRIKAEHGDFTGAVRKGQWDDGVQLVKGDALFTGDLPSQLHELGYNLVDAYATTTVKQGVEKPMVTVICSNRGDAHERVTPQVAKAVESMLERNWFKAYVWLNARKEIPNMTINVFGSLKQGAPSRLVLNTVPAEAPQA